MDKIELVEFLQLLDNVFVITEGKQFIEVSVPAEKLHQTALTLRDNENTLFDLLFCITGVDYKQDLGVIYHLRSTAKGHTLVIKVRTSDRTNPVFDTVSDIWKTAEFHEREIYDLLGIKFNNHPDLRRFFLEKNFGYPLRKDFIDDQNVVTK